MPVGVRLDRARYDQLAKALREHKGNCSASARAAGVSRGTAERAWSRGWVSRGWEAVGPLIATEQREQAARPAVPVVEVDEAERQRQYTAKMAGAALTRGGNLLHLASRLEKYGVQLVTITEKASVEGVPPADAVRLLGAIARFQAKSVDVANAAIAIGKLVAGDAPPTINVNLLTDKTSAQIQLELEAALADLKAGEAAGLDGDGSSPTPPSPDTWAPASTPARPQVSAAATSENSAPLSPVDPLPTMRCCGAAIMVRNGATPDPMHIVLVCPSCRGQVRSEDGGRSWSPLEKLLPVAATQQGLLN